MINEMGRMEYTRQYEYAKAVIAEFIRTEQELCKFNKIEHVDSPLFNIFTFDASMLAQKGATEKLLKLLSSDKETTGFVARLKGCVVEVESSLGEEFIDQLTKNMKRAIVDCGTDYVTATAEMLIGRNNQHKILTPTKVSCVEEVFTAIPWAWIIPIGHAAYRPSLLKHLASTGL